MDKKILQKLLQALWPKHNWPLRARVIFAVACLCCAKAVAVYMPFIYKYIIDDLSPNNSQVSLPVALIFAYAAARFISRLFAECRDVLFIHVTQSIVRQTSLTVFQHLHRLSLGYHLNKRTGVLSKIIERGVKAIEFIMSFMVFNIVPTLIELLLVTIVLYWHFDAHYALITCSSIVLYIFFTFVVTEWRLKYRKRMNESDNEAHGKAIDSLLNYETVKYFTNEAYETNRFDGALLKYQAAAIKNQYSLATINLVQTLIISVGALLIMLLAAHEVSSKQMTMGDFVLVNTYLLQLYMPLNFLGFVYRQMKQSFVDMHHMFDVLDEPVEITEAENATPLEHCRGHFQFQHVDFSYQSDRQILYDLSFEAAPGQQVAIVGPSGAGKSTIFRLIMRFYDPTQGQILLDNQALCDISLNSLRKHIGVIPQDCVLFNDSIHYNIQYGDMSATPEDIQRAAKAAAIHDFIIRLPQGYDTLVGERGLKLSGGEKQRIAIARALLKSPAVMIFDEATSSLDSQTEMVIQDAIRGMGGQQTCIIIAHRLSTIQHVDKILVVDQGRIIESGNHQELLANKHLYASMWHKQVKLANARATLDVLSTTNTPDTLE